MPLGTPTSGEDEGPSVGWGLTQVLCPAEAPQLHTWHGAGSGARIRAFSLPRWLPDGPESSRGVARVPEWVMDGLKGQSWVVRPADPALSSHSGDTKARESSVHRSPNLGLLEGYSLCPVGKGSSGYPRVW